MAEAEPDVPPPALDGEGNPIDDEPLVQRAIDQWPLSLVLLAIGAGLAVMAFGEFRTGGVVVGLGVLLGAAMRALLPEQTAGLLVVRSRPLDLLVTVSLGVALVVVTVALPAPR